jgi:small GTP-binding protein
MSRGEPDYRFKVVVIGAAGSGKTAIVDQLLTGQFTDQTKTTIGVDYRPYRTEFKQHVIQLELWDTAGQETYKAVAKSYFRSAIGCFIVFDTTSRSTFDELQFWLSQFRLLADSNAVILLIGNKVDLEENREVPTEMAEQFAKDHLLEYLETSAVTAQNVKEAFERVSRQIFDLVQDGKIQIGRSGDKLKGQTAVIDDSGVTLSTAIAHTGSCGC